MFLPVRQPIAPFSCLRVVSPLTCTLPAAAGRKKGRGKVNNLLQSLPPGVVFHLFSPNFLGNFHLRSWLTSKWGQRSSKSTRDPLKRADQLENTFFTKVKSCSPFLLYPLIFCSRYNFLKHFAFSKRHSKGTVVGIRWLSLGRRRESLFFWPGLTFWRPPQFTRRVAVALLEAPQFARRVTVAHWLWLVFSSYIFIYFFSFFLVSW